MPRQAAPQANALDRAIAAVFPGWALRRTRARVAADTLSALSGAGGYAGAALNERLIGWQPGTRDADGDTVRDLSRLRSLSRDLVRNSPIAGGAIETQVSHVVGTGLMLQPAIDAELLGLTPEQAQAAKRQILREWGLWSETSACDVNGELSFYEMQGLAFRSCLESGDVFPLMVGKRRQGIPYTLALQLIEADRVCNPENKPDTEQMVAGIVKDATGAPVAAMVSRVHPGRSFGTVGMKADNWQRVEFYSRGGRRQLLHLYRKIRPGQTRGIPCLAPVIEPLKQLGRYTEAEIAAAVVSGVFSVFVKMDPDTFSETFEPEAQKQIVDKAKSWDGTLNPGAAVNLLPGESIESASASRPNPNFDPFVQAIVRQIGVGLGIPFEVLIKHFTASYSAARAALLDAWRTFKIRREWLAEKLCQPVFEAFLEEAVALGRVSAPGFFADPAIRRAWCRAKWIGDGPGSINPRDEAEAAKVRLEIGLTTLEQEIVEYDGGDWETKHAQQLREHEARSEFAPEPVQPATATPPQQDPVDEEDPADMSTRSEMRLQAMFEAFSARMQPAAPPSFNVTMNLPDELKIPAPVVQLQVPEIVVPTPTVHVEAPQVHVAAPEVRVEVAAPEVHFEAVMPKPEPPKLPAPASGWELVKDEAGVVSGLRRIQ